MNTLIINIDLVPREVTVLSENKYEMPNWLGMDCIGTLKRRNPYNEQWGGYDNLFNVGVEPDTLTITLLPHLIEYHHDGDVTEALLDAIRIIDNYYPSVGWEFLDCKD